MNEDRATLDRLRERIETQHREALRALEVLERYLEEKTVNIGENGHSESSRIRGIQPGSQREQIAHVLTDFKDVSAISKATGLSESAVRGCLYAKDFRRKVDKRKINKKLHFRMKRHSA